MNCIFLDLDGVMNSMRSVTAFEELELERRSDYRSDVTRSTIDPVSVGLINRLIEETDAKLVISSSHRFLFFKKYGYGEAEQLDLLGLRKYIHDQGVIGEIIDATSPYDDNPRGSLIKQWLKNHPEVENYLILDDDSDMLEEQLPHFVQTSTANGFMFEHYKKAREILNLSPSSLKPFDLCRTVKNFYTSLAYEDGQEVVYSHNGNSAVGVIRGMSFLSENLQIYVVEDISGLYPTVDYPFKMITVPHSCLSLSDSE